MAKVTIAAANPGPVVRPARRPGAGDGGSGPAGGPLASPDPDPRPINAPHRSAAARSPGAAGTRRQPSPVRPDIAGFAPQRIPTTPSHLPAELPI